MKPFDQLGGFAQIMGLSGHQAETDKLAERVCQGQYFGGNSTTRPPYSLALSPPFAPCPWW